DGRLPLRLGERKAALLRAPGHLHRSLHRSVTPRPAGDGGRRRLLLSWPLGAIGVPLARGGRGEWGPLRELPPWGQRRPAGGGRRRRGGWPPGGGGPARRGGWRAPRRRRGGAGGAPPR